MPKPNVRGKGRKDQRINELEDLVKKLRAQVAERETRPEGPAESDNEADANPFTAPVGRVRRRQVRARAYDLYRGMGGDAIDQGLRNATLKGRSFSVQIRAAEANQPAAIYGPDITPYEDRMSNSLVARLSKEKRALMDMCLKEAEIDAQECEDLGADFESEAGTDPMAGASKPTPPRETPRLDFTEEEKQSLLDWLEGGQQGNPPEVSNDIRNAISFCRIYPRYMSEDLLKLTVQIDDILQKRQQAKEAVGASAG